MGKCGHQDDEHLRDLICLSNTSGRKSFSKSKSSTVVFDVLSSHELSEHQPKIPDISTKRSLFRKASGANLAMLSSHQGIVKVLWLILRAGGKLLLGF